MTFHRSELVIRLQEMLRDCFQWIHPVIFWRDLHPLHEVLPCIREDYQVLHVFKGNIDRTLQRVPGVKPSEDISRLTIEHRE